MPSGDACQTRSLPNSGGFPDCSANLRVWLRTFLPSGPLRILQPSPCVIEEAQEGGGREGWCPQMDEWMDGVQIDSVVDSKLAGWVL